MFVIKAKAKVKAKVKVKVKDRDLNLRVKVISLFLYNKRGYKLLEKMCYKRRLKDRTKEAINNDNNKEILN